MQTRMNLTNPGVIKPPVLQCITTTHNSVALLWHISCSYAEHVQTSMSCTHLAHQAGLFRRANCFTNSGHFCRFHHFSAWCDRRLEPGCRYVEAMATLHCTRHLDSTDLKGVTCPDVQDSPYLCGGGDLCIWTSVVPTPSEWPDRKTKKVPKIHPRSSSQVEKEHLTIPKYMVTLEWACLGVQIIWHTTVLVDAVESLWNQE